MENTLEDLVSTMERNAIDNKAEITNVKLWANSWRREFTDKLEELIEETELTEYHSDLRLESVKNQLQQWIIVDGKGRRTTVSLANLESGMKIDPKLFVVKIDRKVKDSR